MTLNFERFCKTNELEDIYYNFEKNEKEYNFFLAMLMGIYSLDYKCMGDIEGYYTDILNKDKADENTYEWIAEYTSLVGEKSKKLNEKLIFDCNKLKRRYIYDNNYKKWAEKHTYCVNRLARRIQTSVKKDNDSRRACSEQFKSVVIDYFKANNFVPMRIKIKHSKAAEKFLGENIDIDKVAKIVVVGHSFSTYNLKDEAQRYNEKMKKGVDMRIGSSKNFLYDDFVDDQEIFVDLFSGKKLKEIDYYNYWDDSNEPKDNIYNIESEKFKIKRLAKPNVNVKICSY